MEIAESRWFRAYAQWIMTHRVVVVWRILGITGFLATRLGTLQVDSNPNLWAPQKHPYVETTNLLEEVFGGTQPDGDRRRAEAAATSISRGAGEDQAHPGRRSSCCRTPSATTC